MVFCGYMELLYPQMIYRFIVYPQAYPHLYQETAQNKAYKTFVSGVRSGYEAY